MIKTKTEYRVAESEHGKSIAVIYPEYEQVAITKDRPLMIGEVELIADAIEELRSQEIL